MLVCVLWTGVFNPLETVSLEVKVGCFPGMYLRINVIYLNLALSH